MTVSLFLTLFFGIEILLIIGLALTFKFCEDMYFIPLIFGVVFFPLFFGAIYGVESEEIIRKEEIPIISSTVDEYRTQRYLIVEGNKPLTFTDAQAVNNPLKIYKMTYTNKWGYTWEEYTGVPIFKDTKDE